MNPVTAICCVCYPVLWSSELPEAASDRMMGGRRAQSIRFKNRLHLVAEMSIGHDHPDASCLGSLQFFNFDMGTVGDQLGIRALLAADFGKRVRESATCRKVKNDVGNAVRVLVGELSSHAE